MMRKPLQSSKRKSPSSGANRRRASWWILTGLVLFILVVFLTGSKSFIKLFGLYRERQELMVEKERLEAENQQLLREIDQLQNNLDYVEKVAREKYNLKREDEEVYEIAPQTR